MRQRKFWDKDGDSFYAYMCAMAKQPAFWFGIILLALAIFGSWSNGKK